MSKIIGIDLGTSNSAAAVMEGGQPKVIKSAEGTSLYGKTFPSIVAFTENDEMLIGEPARRQAITNPEGTIAKAKRKMGEDFKYEIRDKEYTPQQISAFILEKIKSDAEEYLGEEVDKAVITVPAYFDDNQRQATKDAGKIAGLEVMRLVNEPTSAALAYGLNKSDEELKIMVFDFGAGTLDVTIMDFGDGVFEVQSTSGDTNLGGSDMDELLVEHILDKFEDDEGIDLSDNDQAMQRIREAAEKAKIELSSTVETEINLPFIAQGDDGAVNLEMKITRSELEKLIQPIIDKCKEPIDKAIDGGNLSKDDIDKVILVGGPTRMPSVQDFVGDYVGQEPEGGIDPMECVSEGAAIQGAVLSGDVKDVLLLDVTPLSLGIETLGGVFTKLIEKNTTIPTKKSKVFSTAEDNQSAVTIRVFQGERSMAEDNKHLGQFDLVGIPPAPRGTPQIEVTFDIDANGIVNVSAKDKGTGKEQSIKITAPQKLDDEEIEKMKKEAEEFAEKDKKKKERIETLNEANGVIHSTKQMIDEMGDKMDDSKKEEIEGKVDELKELLDEEEPDVDKVREKLDDVNETVQEFSKKIYQQAAQQAQAQQGAAGAAPGAGAAGMAGASEDEEDVVDAEEVSGEEE